MRVNSNITFLSTQCVSVTVLCALFFLYNCIYLFIFGCSGSSLLQSLVSSCGEQGLLSSCFSLRGLLLLRTVEQGL